MAKASETSGVEKIVEMIEKLTALELADLAKALSEKFGVTPMPPKRRKPSLTSF